MNFYLKVFFNPNRIQFYYSFRYGHFSGINRKVQMKYQPKGRPRGSSSDDGNSVKHCMYFQAIQLKELKNISISITFSCFNYLYFWFVLEHFFLLCFFIFYKIWTSNSGRP